MRTLLRTAYRVILRLHPHAFRAEVGDEMLWIFDEELRRARAVPLLIDGIRSIFIQHARPRSPQVVEGYYYEVNSAPPLIRFTQAGFFILSLVFFLSLFLSPAVPRLARTNYSAQKSWLFARITIQASQTSFS